MKLKKSYILYIVNVISILLIIVILSVPSSIFRIILGIPFLLFFPGYALYAALFINQKKTDYLEMIAISIGMSIAVTALIGLVLNYTAWGIEMLPQLLTLEGFIIIMSVIARIRESRYIYQWQLITVSDPEKHSEFKSKIGTIFSVTLCLSIVFFISILGFTVASSKTGETYTEFYLLGSDGQAEKYPFEFVLNNSQIDRIIYSDGAVVSQQIKDTLIIGIVNHEQKTLDYSLTILVNGEPVKIIYENDISESIKVLALENEEKWEQKLGFIPTAVGNNQKVEFLLTADNGETEFVNSLHFWINVRIEE
ncbi:MAG: DUF1616 domain-containing protein [Chitinispirillaceae bacterium]|nr:DUF1616 domain-containing protein [Chitinispirillaceae bacterium]